MTDLAPAGSAVARMAEIGLELPARRESAGNYVSCVRSGSLLFLSGSGSEPWVGRLGADLTLEQGRHAARASMLHLLAHVEGEIGSLDRVAQVVKLLGLVACSEDFTAQPAVIDGASDLLIELFGERGRHARSAIGVQALPRGFAVEIEMVLEVDRGGDE